MRSEAGGEQNDATRGHQIRSRPGRGKGGQPEQGSGGRSGERAKGKRVTVVGFGTFLPRKRKARAGRSPVNGKEIKINAKTLPAFAAGQGFKEAVDKT